MITFLVTCGTLVIWFMGGNLVISGSSEVSLGLLVSFISYASMFYNPVNFFANIGDTYQNTLASAEKILDILDAEFYSGEKFEGLELHRMFPITGLSRYISLIDSEGEEIAVIRNIDNLLPESKEAVEQCLDEYYMIPRIKRFIKMREKFLIWMWTVETDRGICTFEIRNHLTAVKPLYDGRILIKDANDNRYEIPDVRKLDKKSCKMIDPKI